MLFLSRRLMGRTNTQPRQGPPRQPHWSHRDRRPGGGHRQHADPVRQGRCRLCHGAVGRPLDHAGEIQVSRWSCSLLWLVIAYFRHADTASGLVSPLGGACTLSSSLNPSDLRAPTAIAHLSPAAGVFGSCVVDSTKLEHPSHFVAFSVRGCLEMSRSLQQIAFGLSHLHGLGLGHGDVKPTNVLLFDDGNGGYVPKMCDFGMVRGEQRQTTRIKCS